MGRLPTREEDARWTGRDDPYEAHRLVVNVKPRDHAGKHRVEIRCNGIAFFDTLDVFNAFARRKCREAAISKCQLPEGAHADIEERLLSGAEAADSQKGAATFKPAIVMLDSVKPRKVQWLFKNRIAIGKNNLLAGMPGVGKSQVVLSLAATVSKPRRIPGICEGDQPPGGVVILTMEDDAEDTIAPRLIAHGADLSRIALVKGLTEVDGNGEKVTGIDLLHDIDMVTQAVTKVPDCRMVIVDTINDYVGAKTDTHKNSDTRAIMNPLAAMAAELGVATLLISHFRKGESNSAVNSVMGSIGFVGQARVAWAITRCPTHPRRRLMTCIKNNLAEDTTGLAFTIEPLGDDGAPVVCWEAEPLRMTADEAMQRSRPQTGRKPKERQDASDWLARQLADGPRSAASILNDATAAGMNRRTIQRAFNELGCVRTKGGFRDGWKWSLPQDDSEDDTNSQCLTNSHPGNLRENPEENNTERVTKHTLPARVTECERGIFEIEEHECNGHDQVPFQPAAS